METIRILVFSDTHLQIFGMQRAIELHRDVQRVIHLGDCTQDIDDMKALYPDRAFYAVHGNCDLFSNYPSEDSLVVAGRKIVFAHGHLLQVKYGLQKLKKHARQEGADIMLYGHTHVAHTEYDDGLYIMNPGSLSQPRRGRPSYGIIDILEHGIVTNVAVLQND
ncbi:metallophosphoesterase [Candidatus Soleaferrea massiliensis]|uniref:metallophosphoesterase n=1 Tax=Candidatus Soleaferrea massiliensis TaxID=1470354 RepID=UPI0006944406|nr:metallophosphoesterase [Candidatus Soleaferrea massiliensis]